jgi:regulator of sigma E protease
LTHVLETFGSFVLVLGILVFVHELGHFLAAKAFGIGVPVFSLGFGPRIVGFRRRETDYRLSAIPLGGYVRLTGDEADEGRAGRPEEFLSRPRWQRVVVYAAGALFNIVLAVALTWVTLAVWGEVVTDQPPVVGQVVPGSGADRAGIVRGDVILEIEGRDARDPRVELEEILMSPDVERSVRIDRGGQILDLVVPTGSDPRYRMGFPGWDLVRGAAGPPEIGVVVPGEPAEQAGLEVGDRVVAAEDQRPIDEVALRALLAASADRDVRLVVERGGEERAILVRPRQHEGQGRIGVQFFTEAPRRELGVAEAGAAAVRVNVERSSILFVTLGKLFQREISVRAFSGPVSYTHLTLPTTPYV